MLVKTVVSDVKLLDVEVVVVVVVVMDVTIGSNGISQSTGKKLSSHISISLIAAPSCSKKLHPNGIGKPSYHPNQSPVVSAGVHSSQIVITLPTISFVIFPKFMPKRLHARLADENGNPPGIGPCLPASITLGPLTSPPSLGKRGAKTIKNLDWKLKGHI